MVTISGASYHGGFTHVGDIGPNLGNLVLGDESVSIVDLQQTLTRNSRGTFELCRTKAIASVEVTSEQVAKSKVGAAVVFGVLGGVAAKGTRDRATLVVTLKNGEKGYFTVNGNSTPQLLGTIAPWLKAENIALGKDEPIAALPPRLIADELVKLAGLRDSGALSEEEFVALKSQLIQDATGG